MVFGVRKSKLVRVTFCRSPRNTVAFDGQINIGKNLQLMVAHVALHAIEVEIDVVCQIHRARLVHSGAILNSDPVIVGQAVVRGCRQITGIALIAIAGGERKQRVASVSANNLPAALIKTFRSAVELMASLVGGRQIDELAIEGKAAVGNTVSVTAYGSAKVSGLARIVAGGRAAEQRFSFATVRQGTRAESSVAPQSITVTVMPASLRRVRRFHGWPSGASSVVCFSIARLPATVCRRRRSL